MSIYVLSEGIGHLLSVPSQDRQTGHIKTLVPGSTPIYPANISENSYLNLNSIYIPRRGALSPQSLVE